MKKIIDITPKALDQMSKIISQEEKSLDKYIRLGVIGGGCSGLSYKIDFDLVKDNDYILDFNNIKVIIDMKSAIYLKGSILDFHDGLNGKGFVFKNPSATNTCGCGESFSV